MGRRGEEEKEEEEEEQEQEQEKKRIDIRVYVCVTMYVYVCVCVYMDVCINDTRTDENNTFAWYGVRAATVRGEASRRWFCPYDALPPVALTPPPRRLPSPTVEDHPGPRSLGWFTLKPSGTYLRHPRDSLSSLPFGSCLLPLPLFPCPFLFRSASLPFLSLSLFDPPLSIVPRLVLVLVPLLGCLVFLIIVLN